jgi:hypothetical protein
MFEIPQFQDIVKKGGGKGRAEARAGGNRLDEVNGWCAAGARTVFPFMKNRGPGWSPPRDASKFTKYEERASKNK